MLADSTSFGDFWFAGTHTRNKGKKKHKTQHKHTKDFILCYTYKKGPFVRANRRTRPRPTHIREEVPHVSLPAKDGGERRCQGVDRTPGSAEPRLAPVQVHFG